jgi:hypothetical protein
VDWRALKKHRFAAIFKGSDYKMRFLVFLFLAAAGAQPMLACDLCSIYAASEAQGAGKGFFGGAAEQFTHFGSLQSGGQTVANDGEYIDSLNSQVFIGYNFNQRFGVQLNLPIIYRQYCRQYTSVDDGHVFSPAKRNETGVGDMSLIGNFRAYKYSSEDFTFSWTALGGLKLPTGGTGQLKPANPDFATGIGGHDLTFGSGSVDGLVGTGIFTRWGKLFLNANVQYAVRTEGAYDYEYANDLSWSGGPGIYLALEDNYTVAFQVAVSGESKGPDTLAGVPTDDTATTIVYLGPQIDFTWSDKLSAHTGVDLPASIASTGNQLVPDYRIHAAVTWRF